MSNTGQQSSCAVQTHSFWGVQLCPSPRMDSGSSKPALLVRIKLQFSKFTTTFRGREGASFVECSRRGGLPCSCPVFFEEAGQDVAI